MDGSVNDLSYSLAVNDVLNVDDDITRFNELFTPLDVKRDDVLDKTELYNSSTDPRSTSDPELSPKKFASSMIADITFIPIISAVELP